MMAAFSMSTMAQTSATIEATAVGASLIVPLKIEQKTTLNFGSITLLNASGGTVLLPSDKIGCTYTGGVTYSAVGAKALNALYVVTGTMNSEYSVTLPGTITVKETTKNEAVMSIGSFKAHFAGAGEGVEAVNSKLSDKGVDNFTIGGTLTVAPDQIGGIYAGTFAVTVDYK